MPAIAPACTYFAAYPSIWARLVAPHSLTLVPDATGFDHRPVARAYPHVRALRSRRLGFRKHFADAKAFADSLGQNTLLIDAWNKRGKGSSLGPPAEHGFDLSQAIPRVLAPAAPLRLKIVPQDVGIFAPEFKGGLGASVALCLGAYMPRRHSSSVRFFCTIASSSA